MDIRINLLPPQKKAEWVQKQNQRRIYAVSTAAFLVFAVVYGMLFTLELQARGQIARADQQLQALETQAIGYAQYTRLQNAVKETEAVAQKAMGTHPDWVEVLTDVSLYLPGDVWLTDIVATNDSQNRPELTLRGYSTGYPAVAVWLEDLRLSSNLKDVRCQFASGEGAMQQTIVRFEVKAGVVLPLAARKAGTN